MNLIASRASLNCKTVEIFMILVFWNVGMCRGIVREFTSKLLIIANIAKFSSR